MTWTANVLTIFPEAFTGFLDSSLLGKGREKGLVRIELVDIRTYAGGRHRSTDDAPYGGGAGMVMLAEPVIRAMESVVADRRVLLTPQGRLLQQRDLVDLSTVGSVTLVCGRYEGFDERVRSFVDDEISIGDFVLNGGEVAAMIVIDGTVRLLPGVVGNPESLSTESHAQGLLEYPQYTRPAEWRGLRVPDVLLSGDHAAIARWRRRQAMLRTRQRRPDLWARFAPDAADVELLGDDE
jgi:tRNA (guanine37-N1)-methyltransferase